MNRPIKFRVWRKDKKCWLRSYKDQGVIFGSTEDTCDEEIEEFGGWPIEYCASCKDMVVQQSLGIQDNDGVEIYEGDILKVFEPGVFAETKYTVKYHVTVGVDSNYESLGYMNIPKKRYVVGNILEE